MINRNRPVWKYPAFFYAVYATLIFLLIQFVLRLAVIKGESMANTLQNGDVVAIWQWNYRPMSGDIVITNSNNPFGVRLTKRVVAVGGEYYSTEEGQEL